MGRGIFRTLLISEQQLRPGFEPRALIRNHRDLYVETWGLTVEHELPANFLFTTSYLGSQGVRLFTQLSIFAIKLSIRIDSTGNQCVRPLDAYPVTIPGQPPIFYGSVDDKNDIGGSSYNGLLLSVQRRITNELVVPGQLCWSHSINDGSVGGGESNAPEIRRVTLATRPEYL